MKRGMFRSLYPVLLCAVAAAPPVQASQPSSFVYNLKVGAGQGTSMQVGLAVDVRSMAADGTRIAKVTVNAPQLPIDGKEVDASISPAGAIAITAIQTLVNPLNMFANGCAAAPLQNVGTSWHVLSPEQIDVVFTIIGHQQVAGRDTLAVRMSSPSGAAGYTGQGNYDPDAHLVVSLHSELHQAGRDAQVLDVAMAAP